MENEVKYQVLSSMNEDILEIILTGEATDSTFENVLNDVNAAIKASKATKAIADFRGMKRRIDSSDWYRYLRNYHHALLDIDYAIVDLPENDECKSAVINAGLKSLTWFADMDSASKWMKSDHSGRPLIFSS